MKFGKIAVLLSLCLVVTFTFSGCGRPYSGYDLDDYLTAGTYNGLEVKSYKVTVSSKEIDKEINSKLKAAATTKSVKTGTVKKVDPEAGRATVELAVTSGGAKVLGRALAVVSTAPAQAPVPAAAAQAAAADATPAS